MSFAAESAGRFAREALEGADGEVCALFRRSFYLRCPGERYVCVGDPSVGNGPLNVLVPDLVLPRLGDRVAISLSGAKPWQPPVPVADQPRLEKLRAAAAERTPGAITPSAPPSSTREMYSGVLAGTRTKAGSSASSAMMQSWLVVSIEKLECSRSI